MKFRNWTNIQYFSFPKGFVSRFYLSKIKQCYKLNVKLDFQIMWNTPNKKLGCSNEQMLFCKHISHGMSDERIILYNDHTPNGKRSIRNQCVINKWQNVKKSWFLLASCLDQWHVLIFLPNDVVKYLCWLSIVKFSHR